MSDLIRFPEFLAQCSADNAELHPAIVEAGQSSATHDSALLYVSNDGMLAAIAAAGRLKRIDRYSSLVEGGPLTVPSAYYEDVPALALTRLLNSSLEVYDDPPMAFHFNNSYGEPINAISACQSSEAYLAWLFTSWATPDNAPPPEGGEIIMHEGEPVIVRMSGRSPGSDEPGIPSAIALWDVEIAGIQYPAGSLLRVQSADVRDTQRLPSDFVMSSLISKAITTVDSSRLRGVGFSRLLAFALPPARRWQRFGEAELLTYMDPIPLLHDGTMQELRAITAATVKTVAQAGGRLEVQS